MGSKSKSNANEDALKAAAAKAAAERDAAMAKAELPDPLEARQRDYVTKIWDWRDEKNGPMDIRKFPDATAIALYNDAKKSHDAGRVGTGLATLEGNVNPNYAASLDKEMQMERDTRASGLLEEQVDDTLAGADVAGGNLAAMGNARSMNIAGLRQSGYNSDQDRFMAYLMRPRQPSFLRQMALSLAGSAGAAAKFI